MKKWFSILVLVLVLSVVVTAQENLKPKYSLNFGESLEVNIEMGEQFRVRAREQSQIDLTLNGDQGRGNFKVIIDEITTDKIIVRTSINGEKFKTEEFSTHNILKGSENHYKINLYGGSAPEILLRPEITNANGEKEQKSVVIFFNIYTGPIKGKMPEPSEIKNEEKKEEVKENSLFTWGILVALIAIMVIVLSFKKKRKTTDSGEHVLEKVESPVVDIKEEHKAIEPGKKVRKSVVKKKTVKKKSSKEL
ncbi:hypothetical protein J4459_03880 [Candidatus Woesearchaeota archaeon]|nr:hypothetical protein [Candidatus Woesearchaeota archaeon]